MLTLTENASTIVKDLTAQTGSNEAAGLRISAADSAGPALAVTAAPQPMPGDQVVEQDGATVYLDGLAAAQLDDKVLDAGVDETGNVQFSLVDQT